MQSTEPQLDIRDLTISFNNKAVVDKVNFAINCNEVLALLGESGSGKTLTALAIMRLLPSNGFIDKASMIQLVGQDLTKLSEANMRKIRGGKIGIVFQEPMTALNPVLTIGSQIAEVLQSHLKLRGKVLRQRTVSLLHEVGLPEPDLQYNRYPHQLSGGMRQRVCIGMAIATEPDLLIADEPTSALDVFTQIQILKLLKTLQAKTGMAVLFITHDLAIAKKIANRIVVMRAGKVVDNQSIQTFFEHPQHIYSKKLIQALIPTVRKTLSAKNFHLEQPLLKLDNIKIHFPIQKGLFRRTVGWVKAVDGVSLQLYPGQTIAVVGESGSGKTTLAKAVLQLIKITDGIYNFNSTNLRADIQIIFQDTFSSLNPRMLVGDIIAEGLLTQKMFKTEAEKEVEIDRLLTQVGLPTASKDRYPHEFSGGQRQRIGIARAIAVKPKLIVCDEPTSALDVFTQIQILNLLEQLQNKFNLSYLFITHNIPIAARIADEIAVMYQGKIIEQNRREILLKNPQHPYTKALLNDAL